MDSTLTKIVTDDYCISESINARLLNAHTKKINPYELRFFNWSNIQHLHILGSSEFSEIENLRQQGGVKPGCYLGGNSTWLLVIGATCDRISEYLSRCSAALEVLTVSFTPLKSLELAHLSGLKELNLSRNENLSQVGGLEKLTELRKLIFKWTRMGPMLDINPYQSLEEVNVAGTPIGEIKIDHPLRRMTRFWANYTKISDMRFLELLPRLESLSIINTPVSDLSEISFPKSLTWLDLSRIKIKRIPDGVRCLTKLRRVYLSGLELDELPDWLPELGLGINTKDGIDLSKTKVVGVDMSIFSQSQDVIRQWFEDRKKAQKEEESNAGADLNEVKVVFLGDGEAGKTHTITRLLKGGEMLTADETPGDATPGIVIKDRPYDLDDRRIQVHFWDFGGQEILHSMHRIFLTERTLYVVLLNARDNTQNERARYWLHNIRSFAGDAPVLLVLNKTDQNEHATVNISDLREICPNLPEAVYLSALRDSPAEFNRKLTGAMLDAIRDIDTIRTFFPNSWKQVKDALQTMETPYIKGGAYKQLCDDNRVDEKIQRDVLDLFKTLGVSFYYPGVKLEDYVVLRPNWITNAIYIILFNKRNEVKSGLISHETIYRLLNPRPGDAVKRVLPDATYSNDEVTYVLDVVRRFRLSYLVEDGMEFIPALCDSNSLPVAAEYAADPNALEFRMVYDYLPNNVIHRLMVELRQHLERDHVWLTGALFRERSKGFSAVVKTEGNLLRIFVRAEKPRYTADMYLDTIRDALERINADMNLKVAENQVVYKADGIVECFDYDDLILSQELGDTTVTSRVRRKKVPIADILSQTDHRVDAAKEALIGDILSACRSLQANEIYWKAREDDRNTYIRNILRAKGYIVADQTRSGISAGGKQAGELDLDIRREADMPWTILEALNLSGKGDSQIAYWDDHLKKLLDNYNANGLPFLLQVSYVECPKDKFGTLCTAYSEHLRFHSPAQYNLQLQTEPEGYGENHFIQAYQCIYDCDGFPTTVYHFFVRMGE